MTKKYSFVKNTPVGKLSIEIVPRGLNGKTLEVEISVNEQKPNLALLRKDKKAVEYYYPIKIKGAPPIRGFILPPDIFDELVKLNDEMIEEKQKRMEEAFENSLELGFYYGDWYRTIGWFVDGEQVNNRVKKFLEDKYGITDGLSHETVSKYLGVDVFYNKDEAEEYANKLGEKYELEANVKERVEWGEVVAWYISTVRGPLSAWSKLFDEVYVPIKEELEKEEREKEERIRKAIEEAKRTGKEVIVERLYFYNGDDEYETYSYGTEEIRKLHHETGLGIVNVYLVATPDGKVIKKHVPSY